MEDIGAEADDGDDKNADDDVETIAAVQETAPDMLWAPICYGTAKRSGDRLVPSVVVGGVEVFRSDAVIAGTACA